MIEKQLEQGEKFVRISLEGCKGLQWVRELVGCAAQRNTFRLVKALTNKSSETIKDAMIDMQLLLRGVWRFHSNEGREFMGAPDDWLRTHSAFYHDNSLVEESVGAWQRGIRCLLHQANALVFVV